MRSWADTWPRREMDSNEDKDGELRGTSVNGTAPGSPGLRRVLLAAVMSLTDCLVTKVSRSLLGILNQCSGFSGDVVVSICAALIKADVCGYLSF